MFKRPFAQVLVLILIITAFFAAPSQARAGGICGGTYTVERGETLQSIAAICGTTVSLITSANPGIGSVLTVGQVIVVPGINYVPSTPIPTQPPGSTPVPGSPSGYYATYIVQHGDIFSDIARRFGVTVNALWAANPGIQNINLLYVGQTIYIPGSSGPGGIVIQPVPTLETLVPRSWGTVPRGTAYGDVRLTNKSQSQTYVSLQGTTKDGDEVIREYPVEGTKDVSVPAGWYVYVAWVGGEKMVGQFNLKGNGNVSLTFFRDKVVVGQ
jgi:LysM repeat protein